MGNCKKWKVKKQILEANQQTVVTNQGRAAAARQTLLQVPNNQTDAVADQQILVAIEQQTLATNTTKPKVSSS